MAATEGLVLNGLNLQTGAFCVEALDMTPPAKRPEWAQAADADGAQLVRTPLFDNRTVTARIRVAPQANENTALEKVGEVVDMLQEAEQNPGGIPLEWTPANSTKTITFYVLTAAVTSIPIVVDGADAGWLQAAPVMVVAFTCKPFGYGAEVEAAAAKSIETGLSIVVLTVPTVAGDVPAEGRLVIKDTAKIGRRYVEWGLENRYYNAATALILDSEDMTPVGGAQSTALNSGGAYKRAGATKGTIQTTLVPEPTICANTGVLKHIGTYRVKARICPTFGEGGETQKLHLRLAWQDGEGPLRANPWATPTTVFAFCEADLGTITITPALTGTQKWFGQIEAYSENAPARDTLHIDYLVFIPVLEGYGKARAPAVTAAGTVVAFDNFTTGTLSGNLNARTPPVGAAWATSGATTDWTVAAGEIARSTKDTEARFGVIGSAIGNSGITATWTYPRQSEAVMGVILRWTNKENYAFLTAEGVGLHSMRFKLGVVVANVTTVLAESLVTGAAGSLGTTLTGLFTATLDGALVATGTAATGKQFSLSGSSTAIATGGALASGKAGIYDRNPVTLAKNRTFTSISVETLPSIPYCIQSERTMEARSEDTIAADSTGTYYGPVPIYRGSRFYVPQDGEANRTSRIIVKADRNDLEASDEQTIADAFTAQVFATPRYHVIPR
jgi:hypothetical protein